MSDYCIAAARVVARRSLWNAGRALRRIRSRLCRVRPVGIHRCRHVALAFAADYRTRGDDAGGSGQRIFVAFGMAACLLALDLAADCRLRVLGAARRVVPVDLARAAATAGGIDDHSRLGLDASRRPSATVGRWYRRSARNRTRRRVHVRPVLYRRNDRRHDAVHDFVTGSPAAGDADRSLCPELHVCIDMGGTAWARPPRHAAVGGLADGADAGRDHDRTPWLRARERITVPPRRARSARRSRRDGHDTGAVDELRLMSCVALTGATPIAKHPFETRVCAFAHSVFVDCRAWRSFILSARLTLSPRSAGHGRMRP